MNSITQEIKKVALKPPFKIKTYFLPIKLTNHILAEPEEKYEYNPNKAELIIAVLKILE